MERTYQRFVALVEAEHARLSVGGCVRAPAPALSGTHNLLRTLWRIARLRPRWPSFRIGRCCSRCGAARQREVGPPLPAGAGVCFSVFRAPTRTCVLLVGYLVKQSLKKFVLTMQTAERIFAASVA